MRRVGWLGVGLVAAVAACQRAETPEQMQARMEQETAAFKTAIAALEARYEQFEAAGLADSIAGLYTEDAHVAFAHQPPLHGRKAIAENGAQTFSMARWKLDIRSEEAAAMGAHGMDRGTYLITDFTSTPNTPPGMAAQFPDTGSYMAHYRMVDGKWLIAGLVTNSMRPLPMPATPAPARK